MAKTDKASIGVAMIAYNAEHTLRACLTSFKEHVSQVVVCVDERTTDKTAKLAKQLGAEVHPVKVSDWHECPAHGRILAQDFAAARNESFTYLDPDLEWHTWVDSDDVLEGAAFLPQLTKNVPAPVIGFWSPYHYSYVLREDGSRHVNTLFHRERLFRTKVDGAPVEWTWKYRVHEVCAPNREGPWVQANNLIWVHQHQQHKTETSAPRNLALLEIEYEEKGDDPRTVFYMGNQFFAMGQWQQSADWYERYTRLTEHNPYELWQSYVYMSNAYEQLGNLDGALQAAFGAIEARPEHPEPYYRLAHIYAMTGEYDKVDHWTKQGDQAVDAPFFAFKNPMDRTFNSKMPQAEAHFQRGRISEARQAWEEAVKAFPDPRVLERIEDCKATEKAMAVAQAYYDMSATMAEDDRKLDLFAGLPDSVKKFGRTRNVAVPILMRRRKVGSQPRIIFWCGRALEPWAPPVLNTTGIGGSETAVVEIAKRFAKAGWRTDVYCGADFMEGEYEGVGYWDPERLGADEACDVLVAWRQPKAHGLPITAKQRVLWCHDLNYGPDVAEDMRKWDMVLGVSAWHMNMLVNYYGVTGGWVPNGIDLSRFYYAEANRAEGAARMEVNPPISQWIKKVPFQCVYASSPDRGLLKLLDLWPGIIKDSPTARLHVAYGWENADKAIANGNEQLGVLKQAVLDRLERLGESVVWRGRLPQDELAKLYSESYLWLFPTDFLEVSCISAMEAMAGGAVPVTSACGALPETIGGAGFLLPSPTFSRAYAPLYQKVVSGALMDTQARLVYAAAGRERAKGLTWDKAFERWLQVLGVGVEAKMEIAA